MRWKTASNLFVVSLLAAFCLLGTRFHGHTLLLLENAGSSAADLPTHFPRTTRERSQEEAIREVVVRYQLTHPALPGRSPIYFLSVYGDDKQGQTPAIAVVSRLDRSQIEPGSRATARPNGLLHERGSGMPGVSLCQGEIRWIGRNEAEVDSNEYESPTRRLCATFHLVHRDDAWVVANAPDS